MNTISFGAANLCAIPIPPHNHADCVTPNLLRCLEFAHPCNFFRLFETLKIARLEKQIEVGLPRDNFSHLDSGTSIALYVPIARRVRRSPRHTSPYSTRSSMRLRRNPPIKNAASSHPNRKSFSASEWPPKDPKTLYFQHFLLSSDDSFGHFTIMSIRNNYWPYWISPAAKYKKTGPGKAVGPAPRVSRLPWDSRQLRAGGC